MKLSKKEYYLSGTIVLLLAMVTSGWCSMAGMPGHKSEIIHPFISISGEYTDNLFSTEKNEEDDFFSRITPGVIIALPKINPDMMPIDSASYAPAGEMGTRIHQLDTMGKLQACVKYAPTFENYADYESRDIVTHQLDAYAMMGLRNGLAFELINQYRDNRDPVEEQTDSAEFNNNLVGLSTSYTAGAFVAQLDVRYFDVNYEARKPIKDREDLGVKGTLLYKPMAKVKIFGEMSHVDIDYDHAAKDSDELKLYGGIIYDPSRILSTMLKLGFMDKDRGTLGKSESTLSYEASLWLLVNNRTGLRASSSRMNKESTIGMYATETNFEVRGSYDITQQWVASLGVELIDEEYEGLDREDTTFIMTPALEYTGIEGLNCRLAYTFGERDATGAQSGNSDYTRNTVTLTFTGTL